MIMRRRNKRTSEREGEDRKGNGAGFDFHHVRFSSDIFCPKIECDSAKKKARNKSRVYINFGLACGTEERAREEEPSAQL